MKQWRTYIHGPIWMMWFRTHPSYSLVFLLSGGGKINYAGDFSHEGWSWTIENNSSSLFSHKFGNVRHIFGTPPPPLTASPEGMNIA
jgi:hypothetical protein